MNNTAKENIKTLVKLQEAETQVVRLKEVLKKIEEKKAKLTRQLKQFEKALENHKEDLLRARANCRDIEMEIKILDERIVKSNEKLRMVKTNKEYQLFLREVDDTKKRKDDLETQWLEYLDKKEKIEQTVQEREKEYLLLKDQIESEKNDIDKQSIDDRELLEEYLSRQKDIGKNIDPNVMSRFKKISAMNNGLAVVDVQDAVCMGCFMNIPPQLYIEVQRGDSLILCPQCSRILYYLDV